MSSSRFGIEVRIDLVNTIAGFPATEPNMLNVGSSAGGCLLLALSGRGNSLTEAFGDFCDGIQEKDTKRDERMRTELGILKRHLTAAVCEMLEGPPVTPEEEWGRWAKVCEERKPWERGGDVIFCKELNRDTGLECNCRYLTCPKRDGAEPIRIQWWNDFGHKCERRQCWHKTNNRNECQKGKPVKGVYPLCKQETCPRNDEWIKYEKEWLAKHSA